MFQGCVNKTVMTHALIKLPKINEQGHLMRGLLDSALKSDGAIKGGI